MINTGIKSPFFKPLQLTRHSSRCAHQIKSKTVCAQNPVFIIKNGSKIELEKANSIVEKNNAKLEFKSGRLFFKATSSTNELDADDLLASTGVCLDGTELRSNVAYLVSPGGVISFKHADDTLIAEFNDNESGSGNAMAEMLLKGMASQASPEVQKAFENL